MSMVSSYLILHYTKIICTSLFSKGTYISPYVARVSFYKIGSLQCIWQCPR